MSKVSKQNLKVDSKIADFINNEVLPGTGVQQEKFWIGFDKVVHELAPINSQLIKKRERCKKVSMNGIYQKKEWSLIKKNITNF